MNDAEAKRSPSEMQLVVAAMKAKVSPKIHDKSRRPSDVRRPSPSPYVSLISHCGSGSTLRRDPSFMSSILRKLAAKEFSRVARAVGGKKDD